MFDCDRVPLRRVRFHVDAGELYAPAVLDVVDAEIVLERIPARDVIVVHILNSPHRSAALVHLAGSCLDLDGDLSVVEAHAIRPAQIECPASESGGSRKGEHLVAGDGRRIDLHGPEVRHTIRARRVGSPSVGKLTR